MCGKRVLIVGIGNSAVDVATNLATEGKYVLRTCYDFCNIETI